MSRKIRTRHQTPLTFWVASTVAEHFHPSKSHSTAPSAAQLPIPWPTKLWANKTNSSRELSNSVNTNWKNTSSRHWPRSNEWQAKKCTASSTKITLTENPAKKKAGDKKSLVTTSKCTTACHFAKNLKRVLPRLWVTNIVRQKPSMSSKWTSNPLTSFKTKISKANQCPVNSLKSSGTSTIRN